MRECSSRCFKGMELQHSFSIFFCCHSVWIHARYSACRLQHVRSIRKENDVYEMQGFPNCGSVLPRPYAIIRPVPPSAAPLTLPASRAPQTPGRQTFILIIPTPMAFAPPLVPCVYRWEVLTWILFRAIFFSHTLTFWISFPSVILPRTLHIPARGCRAARNAAQKLKIYVAFLRGIFSRRMKSGEMQGSSNILRFLPFFLFLFLFNLAWLRIQKLCDKQLFSSVPARRWATKNMIRE